MLYNIKSVNDWFLRLFFFYRLIRHTKCLLEEKEDSLCIKVLQTLREMMTVDNEYGEKVPNSVSLLPYNISK